MTLLICSAQANAGKDACCDYISKKYGFVKIAFADKIKRELMDLYSFKYEQLWGASNERSKIDIRYNKEVREFIQGFGDKGRELNINTWVNYTVDVINKIHNDYGYGYVDYFGLSYDGQSYPKSVIVSDGRYLNELEAIRNMEGKIIRIKRPNSEMKSKLKSHSSEIDQNEIPDSYFDHVIINNTTLEDLYKKIDEYMEKNT